MRRSADQAVVDQISLPMRIALVACLVFAAFWFVALRPKPVDDVSGPLPTTPAPAKDGTSVTDRPAEAEKAVSEANAKTGEREQAADTGATQSTKTSKPSTGGTQAKASDTPKATTNASKPKTAAASTPKATPASPEQPVLADIKAGRTVVLLFSALNVQTDDRAVRNAVAGVDRHGGKVRVHFARMGNLPKYEAITRNAPIQTSPTVLVIDRNAGARTVTGLTTTREIDALVDDALLVEKNG